MKDNKDENWWFSRMMQNRFGEALFLISTSIMISVILGGIFYLLFKNSINRNFFLWVEVFFLLFTAPAALAGVLRIITNIDPDGNWLFGIACGLYYGTIFVAKILDGIGWNSEMSVRYFIAFVIVALICYIFYIKNHPKEKN